MMNSCKFEGCERRLQGGGARGYCRSHYEKLRRSGELELTRNPNEFYSAVCRADGCDRSTHNGDHGWCNVHAQRMRRYGTLELTNPPPSEQLKAEIISEYESGESIYYIGKLHNLNGEKVRHWLVKWGINRRLVGFQPGHVPARRKERKTDGNGYVLVYKPDHPNAFRGFVREHRLIMEAKIGRLLTKNEVVHHINNNPSDNRIENLELALRADHSRDHRVALGRIKNPNNRYKIITLACDCCGQSYRRKIIKLCKPCRAAPT